MASLHVLARSVVEGFVAGLHRSPHRGNSVEFKQHRAYVPGDDLRTLDWKIYGKTDRFFVREFEEETNLRAHLLLDCSGSMAYGQALQQKHAYAVRLAACLSYLMLRQQDGVGLATFDSALREFVPARSTPRHLGVVLDTMTRANVGGEAQLGHLFKELVPLMHRRGLVILLSDCFGDVDDLVRGLAHFKHARHEVIVFQILHREELEFPFADRVRLDDLETHGRRVTLDPPLLRKQYLQRLEQFRTRLAEGCRRNRVDLVPVVTDQPYAQTLAEYLSRRLRGGATGGVAVAASKSGTKSARRPRRGGTGGGASGDGGGRG